MWKLVKKIITFVLLMAVPLASFPPTVMADDVIDITNDENITGNEAGNITGAMQETPGESGTAAGIPILGLPENASLTQADPTEAAAAAEQITGTGLTPVLSFAVQSDTDEEYSLSVQAEIAQEARLFQYDGGKCAELSWDWSETGAAFSAVPSGVFVFALAAVRTDMLTDEGSNMIDLNSNVLECAGPVYIRVSREEAFPENSSVRVERQEGESLQALEASLSEWLGNSIETVLPLDIAVYGPDGGEINIGTAGVSLYTEIPISGTLLYHLGENGWENIAFDLQESGADPEDPGYTIPCAFFTTSGFSPFLFVRMTEPGEDTNVLDLDQDSGKIEENTPDGEMRDQETGQERLRGLRGTANNQNPDGKSGNPDNQNANGDNENSSQGDTQDMTPDADPEGEPETEQQSVKIEKLTVRWLSKSTGHSEKAGFDTLEMAGNGDTLGNMQFQIDITMTGNEDIPEGAMEITIPAYIFKTRDGYEMGHLTLSVPEDPETGGADFGWKRVGNNIIFKNNRKIAAESKLMFQGTWRNTNKGETITSAHEMIDVDCHDSVPYAGKSDPFHASVSISSNGEQVTADSNDIYATINTEVKLITAVMTASSYGEGYRTYAGLEKAKAGGLPESFAPENPDDYIYVRWYVSGLAGGSQPFTMTVADTAEDAYGCIMLGAETGTLVPSEDGKTVSAELYNGYSLTDKSGYIWTAYPKAGFEEGFLYTLSNTMTMTVTGIDDRIPYEQTVHASAGLKLPTTYTVYKTWDDEDDKEGHRPSNQHIAIYRRKTTDRNGMYYLYRYAWITPETDVEGNTVWKYSWTDENSLYDYRVEEKDLASGYLKTDYDVEGHPYYHIWEYEQTDSQYDEQTHTWTFRNHYKEGYAVDGNFSFKKVFPWGYTDSSVKSNRDTVLNELYRGNPSVIYFTLEGNFPMSKHTVSKNKSVHVVIEDGDYTLNDTALQDGDMEFASVHLDRLNLYKYDEYNPETNRYERQDADTPLSAGIYGQKNGEWIKYADVLDQTITAVEGSGASVNGQTLFFPEGVSRFRYEFDTDLATVDWSITPVIRFNPSENIISMIEDGYKESDYQRMIFRNTAVYTVSDETGPLESEQRSGTAYLHGRMYRVAAKAGTQIRVDENMLEAQAVRVHVQSNMTQQSNILSLSEWRYAVETGIIPNATSGVWYNLLPPGVIPDLDTIQTQAGDTIRKSYVVDNFRNTGRALLIVQADLGNHVQYMSTGSDDPDYPRYGYANFQYMEFDCIYPWDEAFSYGFDNAFGSMAFESGQDWIGNLNGWVGEPDDPIGNNRMTHTLGGDAGVMKDLNPDRDATAFVYAGAFVQGSELDFYAHTSIQKTVAVGAGNWTNGHDGNAVVTEGAGYKYKLYMKAETDTYVSDLVILDAIDRYIPEGTDKGWQGVLKGIDTGQMRAAGVNPVIWYCTAPEPEKPEDLQLSEEAGALVRYMEASADWTTEQPQDLSAVTAIAIDCSRMMDGSAFVMRDDKALEATVYMEAPKGEALTPYLSKENDTDPALNKCAYNMAWVEYMQTNTIGNDTDYVFIPSVYTKLGIRATRQNVEILWDDENNNDGIRPHEVSVHLLCNGQDTGITLPVKEQDEWKDVFVRLPYADDNSIPYQYTMELEPIEAYEASYEYNDEEAVITVTHVPETTDITVEKIWEDDELQDGTFARPDHIRVRLYADGIFTGTIRTIVGRDGQWTGEFAGLRVYHDGGIPYEYTMIEEPVTDFITTYEEGGRIIRNRYYPYGDLFVDNTMENLTYAASRKKFTYTLLLRDKDGQPITEQYEYEKGGETGKIRNGSSFTLADGESMLIHNIPSGTSYEFVQEPLRGFMTVTQEKTAGTIRSDIRQEAHFGNLYSSRGSASLQAFKIQNHGVLYSGRFQFTLSQCYDNNEEALVRMASNTGNGLVPFGTIQYTEQDDGNTFLYVAREVQEANPHFLYDDAQWYYLVSVSDNGDGTMTTSVKSGSSIDAVMGKYIIILFENGKAVRLGAKEQEEADYEQLTAENGNITGTRDDGFITITFPDGYIQHRTMYQIITDPEGEAWLQDMTLKHQDISFNSDTDQPVQPTIQMEPIADAWFTELHREVRFPDGYTINSQSDPTLQLWEEMDEDEKMGMISQHQNQNIVSGNRIILPETLEFDQPTFYNQYIASGIFEPKAWKKLEGGELKVGDYAFMLANTQTMRTEIRPNMYDGSISFSPVIFTAQDIGKTYYFPIQEVPGSDSSINYDNHIHGYQINVKDRGDGILYWDTEYKDYTFTKCETCNGTGRASGVAQDVFGQVCQDCMGLGGDYQPLDGKAEKPVFVNTYKPGGLTIMTTVEPGVEYDENTYFTVHARLSGSGMEDRTIEVPVSEQLGVLNINGQKVLEYASPTSVRILFDRKVAAPGDYITRSGGRSTESEGRMLKFTEQYTEMYNGDYDYFYDPFTAWIQSSSQIVVQPDNLGSNDDYRLVMDISTNGKSIHKDLTMKEEPVGNTDSMGSIGSTKQGDYNPYVGYISRLHDNELHCSYFDNSLQLVLDPAYGEINIDMHMEIIHGSIEGGSPIV